MIRLLEIQKFLFLELETMVKFRRITPLMSLEIYLAFYELTKEFESEDIFILLPAVTKIVNSYKLEIKNNSDCRYYLNKFTQFVLIETILKSYMEEYLSLLKGKGIQASKAGESLRKVISKLEDK